MTSHLLAGNNDAPLFHICLFIFSAGISLAGIFIKNLASKVAFVQKILTQSVCHHLRGLDTERERERERERKRERVFQI